MVTPHLLARPPPLPALRVHSPRSADIKVIGAVEEDCDVAAVVRTAANAAVELCEEQCGDSPQVEIYDWRSRTVDEPVRA